MPSFNFTGVIARKSNNPDIELPIKAINKMSEAVLCDDNYYNVSELFLTCPKDLLLCLLLPVFSLNRFDYEDFKFTSEDKRFNIEVISNEKFGRATMYDKSYLLYAIGIVQEMLNAKIIDRKAVNRTLHIDVNKMLVDIKRSGDSEVTSNSDAWNKLNDAGNRLMSTLVTMKVDYGKRKRSAEKTTFINYFKLEQDGDQIVLKMRLSEWVWDAIMKERPADILSLDTEYWEMAPFKRRVYEIFRVNMGNRNSSGNQVHDIEKWKYSEFQKLCGKKTDKNFKKNLEKLFEYHDINRDECNSEFKKAKKRSGLPQAWGTFGIWVVGFYPDKLVVMRKDLLKIPHKN